MTLNTHTHTHTHLFRLFCHACVHYYSSVSLLGVKLLEFHQNTVASEQTNIGP